MVGLAALPLSWVGCASELEATPAPSPTPTESVIAGPCQDRFDATVVQDAPLASPAAMYVQLTNTGSAPCAISGFASEVALVRDAHPLTNSYNGPEHIDAASRATTIVDVVPGGSAYFWLEINYYGEQAPCAESIRSTDLRFTLPGGTAPIFAPAVVDLCVDNAPSYRYGPIDTEQRPA